MGWKDWKARGERYGTYLRGHGMGRVKRGESNEEWRE